MEEEEEEEGSGTKTDSFRIEKTRFVERDAITWPTRRNITVNLILPLVQLAIQGLRAVSRNNHSD